MADVIPTQFQIDCAVMAGAAYVSNRNPINQLPVPPGWTLNGWLRFFRMMDLFSSVMMSNTSETANTIQSGRAQHAWLHPEIGVRSCFLYFIAAALEMALLPA